MPKLTCLLALLLSLGQAGAETRPFLFTTLNCYFFFGGGQTAKSFNQPKFAEDYWKKAENLAGLLPTNAPLFVGLQEIGRGREALNLAQIVAAKYRLRYAPLFVQGKDTFTSENVGALMCFDMGWGIAAQPHRDEALDKWLSKHLVMRITNAVTAVEICVVHLRRAIGPEGVAKQQEQAGALKIWVERHLKENPKTNLVVLGDFNETKKPGDAAAGLAPLVQPQGPLLEAFALSPATDARTHANGKAYDRILVSPALEKGLAGLKFDSLSVREHPFGKGKAVAAYTDHFPLTAGFAPVTR